MTSTSKSVFSYVNICCQCDLQQLCVSITSGNEESLCEMLFNTPFSREVCSLNVEKSFFSLLILFNGCSASFVTSAFASTLRQCSANFVVSSR